MTLRWYSTVVESTDHRALARWWAEALGWDVAFDLDSESIVVPPWARELTGRLDFHQVPPGMVFVRSWPTRTATSSASCQRGSSSVRIARRVSVSWPGAA